MNQQELVWVRFPFSSLTAGKVRPAVVVSNSRYNQDRRDVVACAITSRLDEEDYSIFIDNENLSSGNLPVRSRIRADKIMLLEKTLIIRAFARLDDQTFDTVVQEIAKIVQRG